MQIYSNIVLAGTFMAMTLPFVRKLQLNNYSVGRGYIVSILSRQYLIMLLVEVIMVLLAYFDNSKEGILMSIVSLVGSVAVNAEKVKVRLRYTRRIITLLIVVTMVVVGMLLVVPVQFMALLVPYIVVVAWAITMPIEIIVSRYYINTSRRKLKNCSCTKIAITGSYGKTSVKHILSQLLSSAVASPASYNTPLGVAKFVNETDINNYRYALFEMGARRRGEIDYLCNLVRPDIGIITGIASQHAMTFGSIDNIISTKQELVNYLGVNDTAFLNGYDSVVRQWDNVGKCRKVISTDVVKCTIEHVTIDGTEVILDIKGNQYNAIIPLLGIANVHNVVLAISVCLTLGISAEDLVCRIAELKPLAHRMQVVKGIVTIIDDSYNANLSGITLCCDTVKSLEDCGNKIIIAQGITEGGKMAKSLNRAVGNVVSQAFDVVICIGVNSETIYSAINKETTIVRRAKTIKQAVTIASQYYNDNCILVFGNDIP